MRTSVQILEDPVSFFSTQDLFALWTASLSRVLENGTGQGNSQENERQRTVKKPQEPDHTETDTEEQRFV